MTVKQELSVCVHRKPGAYRSWKVMVLGIDPGKSRKVLEMVAAFLNCVHVFGLYIRYHCLLSDSV